MQQKIYSILNFTTGRVAHHLHVTQNLYIVPCFRNRVRLGNHLREEGARKFDGVFFSCCFLYIALVPQEGGPAGSLRQAGV